MNANNFTRVMSDLKSTAPRDVSRPPSLNRSSKLLLGQEVFRIVGCAMEVLNELGHGLHEKPYENALVVEFGLQGIPVVQQRSFDVFYKQVKVSEFVPDLIAFGKVVVDTKVIDQI